MSYKIARSFLPRHSNLGSNLRLYAQVYNASNNELVRTNTLVKGAIIQIDAAAFRQWYEAHVRAHVEVCSVRPDTA